MDAHLWLMLGLWIGRIGWCLLSAALTRRRAARHRVITQVVRLLPAGGEAGGVLPDGTCWYVRIPAGGGELRGYGRGRR